MGPSPTCHPPEGEECKTLVKHGLLLRAKPAVGYYSRRPRPSPMWGSRFVGARAVGPWVAEQKPLGKTPRRGNPSPESTYLPTYLLLPFSMPLCAQGLTHCCLCYSSLFIAFAVAQLCDVFRWTFGRDAEQEPRWFHASDSRDVVP